MATEQAVGAGRCGASGKPANALCRHFHPTPSASPTSVCDSAQSALGVAPGRVPGSLRPLAVGPATPSGPRLPGHLALSAITLRETVRNPG
jgi:hypothetical protein